MDSLFFCGYGVFQSFLSLFFSLFTFLFRHFDGAKNLETSDVIGGCDDDSQPPPEEEEETSGGDHDGAIEERETNEFEFRFKFKTYEEFSKSNEDDFGCEKLDSLSNKYEILPEKITSCFVGEPEIPSFKVEILNFSPNHEILGNGDSTIREFSGKNSQSEEFGVGIAECSDHETEEFSGKILKSEVIAECSANETEQFSGKILKSEEITECSANETEQFSGKILKSEEITECSANETEQFSGKILKSEVTPESSVNGGETISGKVSEEQSSEKQRKLKQRDEEDRDTDFLSETDFPGSDSDTVGDMEVGFLSDIDFEEVVGYEREEEINDESEEEEEETELETEWEHQELIEQLKMELKKVRAKGLPTIFEESESPKLMEELKPWKIDERFKHGDLMEELHKFYTTYRERMRKFDIFNYQKMYAMGVLQSKDPLKSFSSNRSKSSSPSITSLFSQKLRLYRQNKIQVDPMKDFIREVHCDLEMVYVGQMCLSWEFIQWQYEKALDLWESEPHGLHHYNEVACEFQQFQVLLQRFLENEPFEGPRVENYVKHRCIARNLLQVPVIREDKRKLSRRGGGDHGYEAITNDMLVEILQESIRVIWQFIRADKDHNTTANLKRPKKFQVELQDPADYQLLTEIQTDLQKKEKKLKEIVRSGHCILKKLKKNEENEGALCFFCEVDMKLVGRVLKMSRVTTDQLIWCRNKLSRISFFNKKINVEPSFFLFPCS